MGFYSPSFDLFCLPMRLWVLDVCFYGFFSERKTPFYPPALLTWKVTQEKVPWGIVLLLGGGFALAKGCEVRPPCRLPGPLLHKRASENFVPPPTPLRCALWFNVCLLQRAAGVLRTGTPSCHQGWVDRWVDGWTDLNGDSSLSNCSDE